MKFLNDIPDGLFVLSIVVIGVVVLAIAVYFDEKKDHKIKKSLLGNMARLFLTGIVKF